MNKQIAIKVNGLSKEYTIGKQKSTSLRTSLTDVKNIFVKNNETKFQALNDLNFEISQGDVVGIIGKNGAGKSTLLKLLSQITRPSKGRIEINGRVASLLEVGTGFHPELTGRENIYLNGTILGMTRKEVKAKFDEIVAFSGVEKFIDTPVKHYSSGMYVRLAFAVAAHLEPEILIIDEVLAVGDAAFQKKCLGKMKDISSQGRTVLFVSHDLGAVSSLCNKGIFLQNGEIQFKGSIDETISAYLDGADGQNPAFKVYTNDAVFSEHDGNVFLKEVSLIDANNQPLTNFHVTEKAGIKIKFEVINNQEINPIPNIHLSHSLGGKVLVSVCDAQPYAFGELNTYEATVWFPPNFFNNGYFNVGVAISTLNPVQVHVADYESISFEVIDSLDAPTRNGYTGKIDGYLRPQLDWDTKKLEI